ncbi:MAG: small subunit ribosomal protein S8e [Thermoproteota archaeon]|nr:small subunit ribosomal protein S8e [Thermoproteota archaeon]
MPQWHGDLSKRKITGGRRRQYRSKRAYEMGSDSTETKVGEVTRKVEKAYGNTIKIKLLSEKYANVTNPSTGKTEKVEIIRVVRNPVNVDYDRRRILTKGAVIGTSIGDAVVTSRPGQNGIVNAVLSSGKLKATRA